MTGALHTETEGPVRMGVDCGILSRTLLTALSDWFALQARQALYSCKHMLWYFGVPV